MSEIVEERLSNTTLSATKMQVYQPDLDVVEMLSDLYDELFLSFPLAGITYLLQLNRFPAFSSIAIAPDLTSLCVEGMHAAV